MNRNARPIPEITMGSARVVTEHSLTKMRFDRRRNGTAALILVGAVGLAVSFPLHIEGHLARGKPGRHLDLSPSPGEEGGTPQVFLCGKDGIAREEVNVKSELRAEKGKPLKFKCAPTHTLGPAAELSREGEFKKAYTTDGKGTCQDEEKSLDEIVAGATLTMSVAPKTVNVTDPVYTFQYNTDQSQEKHLCYRCNQPVADSLLALSSAAAPKTACTVRITVPKTESTDSMTEAPSPPTSAASVATITLAGAAGGLLGVMLRM